MSSTTFTKLDALAFASRTEKTGLFEVTPMGPYDYFVHVMQPQSLGVTSEQLPSPLEYNQPSHYHVNDGDILRYGYPGQQIYLRLTFCPSTIKLTVTRVVGQKKRYPIARHLLAMSAAQGHHPQFFEKMIDRLSAEKTYQPTEIVDIFHHALLSRLDAQVHKTNVCLTIDLDGEGDAIRSTFTSPFPFGE